MSTSIDSIGQLINQLGVAESGDGLAVLRFLGLEINAAMVNVLGSDADELRRSIDALGERAKLQLYERLSPAGQLDLSEVPGDDAYWTPQDWETLKADLSTQQYELRGAIPATHMGLDVTFPPGFGSEPVHSESVLSEAELRSFTNSGDWEQSVNDEGRRVWTMTAETEVGDVNYVLTEKQAVIRAPGANVQELMAQIDADTLEIVDDVVKIVQSVQISLREWAMDFLADERMFLRSRKSDERRIDAQAEAAAQEFRQLMDRLQSLDPQWASLSKQLANEAASRQPASVPASVAQPDDSALSRLLNVVERSLKR